MSSHACADDPRSSKESQPHNPHSQKQPDMGSAVPVQTQDDKLIRKKERLKLQIEELHNKIENTRTQLEEANAKLGDVDASARVQRHIKLLHQYNEIKDIGMALFGVVAERRGVRVKDVFEEFGVSEKD